jgi:purine-binding chemotaxis protein CheW
VCFFVDRREFGVPIEHVRETIELRPITPVFGTPPSLAGICNLRGEILAVLDPGSLLGLSRGRASHGRIVVVAGSGGRKAGLWVDGLGPLRELGAADVMQVPPTFRPETAALLDGCVALPDRPLCILSIDRLFAAPELARLAERPPQDQVNGGR